MLLQREIRVVADPQGRLTDTLNRWSGGTPTRCGQTPLVCTAAVSAPLDADGIAVEVHELDWQLRNCLATVFLRHENLEFTSAVRALFAELTARLAPVELVEVSLVPSPQSKFTMQRTGPARITQQFEFSAAHRLFGCAGEGSEPPRDFGKCARVHGHNYVLDVTLGVEPGGTGIAELERAVHEVVLPQLDHRYLNEEVEAFKGARRNPTVEQIAVVIWELLEPRLGAALAAVRLYETPKTWAEYHGPF